MRKFEMPAFDDRGIWHVWLSQHYLATVTAADEAGIFRSLAAAPATAEELARRLGLEERATTTTLRLLAALGFLEVRLGSFQLAGQTRLYLLKDSAFYWGHMLGTRQPQHARLLDVLHGKGGVARPDAEGRPGVSGSGRSSDAWASGQMDVEAARRMAAAMESHSLPAALGLAQNADLNDVRALLDVGGGSGCFSIALARANPNLRCSIMDLAAVCEVASGYISDAGMSERVGTVAVDMFREEWPSGYDALFFSNVFHDWDFETCALLARRAYAALPPGGRILLHEMLLDDSGTGPLTTASFSMLMLLGTQGQQFTFGELKDLLEGAGFSQVTAKQTYAYYSLVSGRK